MIPEVQGPGWILSTDKAKLILHSESAVDPGEIVRSEERGWGKLKAIESVCSSLDVDD